jgi:ABC-type branched-subunit amino acid transport system substrate-binding protein
MTRALSRIEWLAACTAAVLALSQTSTLAADSVTGDAAAAKGRQLYLKGLGDNGAPVVAEVGKPATEISAAVLTCVNCHGRDGRGRPEGGLLPSNIQWSELTKPYGASTLARRRSAYDDELLIRAVTMGIDASGNRLDPAMPRFRLSATDAGNLTAYLRVLGNEPDPGVADDSVKIGVILPPVLTFESMRRAVRETVSAFVQRVNTAGGIYGRRIELCFATAPEDSTARAAAVRDFVERERPFALVASFIAGNEREIIPCLEYLEIPVIGPECTDADERAIPERHFFYLCSGLAGQGRALVDFAAGHVAPADGTAWLVRIAGDKRMDEAVEATEARAAAKGWNVKQVSVSADTQTDWEQLLDGGRANAIFWFAPGSLFPAFAKAAANRSTVPYVFGPGALFGDELFSAPKAFAGRLFVSFPALATDQTDEGRRDFLSLADNGKFSKGGFATRLAALSAAEVMLKAMQQTGRDLTRERLIEELEHLYQFSTGQTPAVTFGPNRRVGADGAHVVSVDLERGRLASPATWVTPK